MKIKILIKLCAIVLAICVIYIYFDFNLNNRKYSEVEHNDLQTINKENTKGKTNESATIKEKEFLIDSKPIIGLQYSDVIKIWGTPKEIRQEKVYFPATPEPSYTYILKYSSIDIEMYPENKNTPVENTRSFRFDITGDEFDFYGVKVGMTLEYYLRTVENKNVYTVKDILSDSKGEIYPYVYRKLLYLLKPENYYSSYDKAIYEQVVINSIPFGAVFLFNADKIARIVYGYPNAS